MSAGDESNENTYYDTVPISGSIKTTYETDPEKNIYTRSMVRDVDATGYMTTSASITSGNRFASIDTEKFDKRFNEVYHDVVLNGEFVENINSYYDDNTHTIQIVAITGLSQSKCLIVEGTPTDKNLLAELEKWGISISAPFGTLYYRVSNEGTRSSSIEAVEITTQQQFSSLCNANDSWTVEIGGKTISNDAIVGIDMPENVSSVGNNFLRNCTNLTMELDTSNLTSIGQHFLSGCTSFNHALDLSNITTLPNNFLYGCYDFNSAVDISGVTSIKDNCFAQCQSFNKAIDAPLATSVGEAFLFTCLDFNNTVNLPEVTTFGNLCFCDCPVFNNTLTIPKVQTVGTSFLGSNVSFNKALSLDYLTNVGDQFLSGCVSLNKALSFPKLATVGGSFMLECSVFNSAITFGSLTTLGSNFMAYCSVFDKTLNLSTVTTIGASFLYYDEAFNKTISIPAATTIGPGFMAYCSSWNQSEMTIPNTVVSFEAPMFYGCDSMVGVYTAQAPATTVQSTAATKELSFSSTPGSSAATTGISFSGTYASNWVRLFPSYETSSRDRKVNITTSGTIEFTDNTTVPIVSSSDIQALCFKTPTSPNFTLGDATYSITNVRSVSIDYTEITAIPSGFLQYASSLQSLSLPNTITEFSSYFLNYCTSYNSAVPFPTALTTIGIDFLRSCSDFNQPITIPSSVTSIGAYFMYGCTSYNQPIVLPNSITMVPEAFMVGCSSFNSTLTLGSATTNIGQYFLKDNTSFNKTITLPSTLEAIGGSFLQGCSAFNQQITLPASLQTIGAAFLNYCTSFNQNLTLPATIQSMNSFMIGCENFTSELSCLCRPSVIASASHIQQSVRSDNTTTSNPILTTGFALTGTYGDEWANYIKTNRNLSTGARFVRNQYGYITLISSGQTVLLHSQADVNNLRWDSENQTKTISGTSVTNTDISQVVLTESTLSIPDSFMRYCTNLTHAEALHGYITSVGSRYLGNCTSYNEPVEWKCQTTHIPDNFLHMCTNLNSSVKLGNATSVGNYFMGRCDAFNQNIDFSKITSIGNAFFMCKSFNKPLTFSSSLASIGDMFLWGVFSFNQNITIPASVTYIGGYFMTQTRAMCSTVTLNCPSSVFVTSDSTDARAQKCFEVTWQQDPSYTTGIYIGGPYRSQWLALWPNNSRRKLR